MHVFTHLKPSSVGKTGHGLYPDGMVELDGYVGELLDKLDELGVAKDTIVVFTTDNGAEECLWPDGGTTPFRGEKDTNWEGGWRVPCVMRWPGAIEPGRVINDICSLQDFIPTFAAVAGEPDLVEKARKGYKIRWMTFKVHLDGVDLGPSSRAREKESPRKGFLYWSDDGDLMALRVYQYKIVFAEQRYRARRLARTAEAVAYSQDVRSSLRSVRGGQRTAQMTNGSSSTSLFSMPHRRSSEWLESFKEFRLGKKSASFTVDQIVEALMPKSCADSGIQRGRFLEASRAYDYPRGAALPTLPGGAAPPL